MKVRLAQIAMVVILAMLAIFAAPLAADAQQPGKMYRIGILGNVPLTT